MTIIIIIFCFFFFKQKTAYEMRISDWSSDVCSSDLLAGSGKTIFRLDCDAADMAGDFPGASARGIRWHRNPDRARQAMAHFAEAMHEAQILIIENLHDLACGDLAFVRDRLCDLPPMSNAILTCRDLPRAWAAPLVTD